MPEAPAVRLGAARAAAADPADSREHLADARAGQADPAGIGKIDIHPAGRSYANLPDFVRVGLARAFEQTVGGQPYATVTASLPDGSLSVTVWAMAQPLRIDPGTADATRYSDCGYLGSTATAKQMAGTGPNEPIDCGVTYLHPGTGFNLTARIGWQVFSAVTTGDGDGPLPPQPGMEPVTDGQLQASIQGRPVNVGEIQSPTVAAPARPVAAVP